MMYVWTVAMVMSVGSRGENPRTKRCVCLGLAGNTWLEQAVVALSVSTFVILPKRSSHRASPGAENSR